MEGVTVTITWHTTVDPCRKCQALNGRTYHVEDLDVPYLMDPEFGPIWDLNKDVSLAHPNCKCYVDVQIDVTLEKLEIG